MSSQTYCLKGGIMNNQRMWSRNFILINLCVIFASFTNFAYIYILPIHVLEIGGSNTDVGLMGAVLTVAGLVTRLALSPLIDRWGRKPMLMLGILLFALNSLGYYFLRGSVAGVIAMRCFSGFSQGILFPVPPTIVSDISPKEKLVDALGIFGIASSLPVIVTPVLGMYLYRNVGDGAFFAVTLVSALISIVFAVLFKDEYKPVKVDKESTGKKKFQISSVLELSVLLPCIVFFLSVGGFSSVNNFAIVAGESRAIAGMSLFFTVHNIVIVLTRLIASRLKNYFSAKVLIIGGLAIIGAGTLLMAFASSFPMMMLASAVMAFGGTIYAQYLQADILLRAPDDRRGVANSTMMLFQDVGAGIGAALFGLTSQHFGYSVTFIVAAVITSSAIMVFLMDKQVKGKR